MEPPCSPPTCTTCSPTLKAAWHSLWSRARSQHTPTPHGARQPTVVAHDILGGGVLLGRRQRADAAPCGQHVAPRHAHVKEVRDGGQDEVDVLLAGTRPGGGLRRAGLRGRACACLWMNAHVHVWRTCARGWVHAQAWVSACTCVWASALMRVRPRARGVPSSALFGAAQPLATTAAHLDGRVCGTRDDVALEGQHEDDAPVLGLRTQHCQRGRVCC